MRISRKYIAIRAYSALLRPITHITLFLDRRVVRTTEKISLLFVAVVMVRSMSRVQRIARAGLEKVLS